MIKLWWTAITSDRTTITFDDLSSLFDDHFAGSPEWWPQVEERTAERPDTRASWTELRGRHVSRWVEISTLSVANAERWAKVEVLTFGGVLVSTDCLRHRRHAEEVWLASLKHLDTKNKR